MKTPSSKKLRDSLTLACCTLLQTVPAAKAGLLKDVNVDTAVLIYSESDNRVSLIEPVIKLKTELNEDEYLSLQLVFDTLSGASPNGAQASNIAQTFTSPSGNEQYTTPAGETPLDITFRDSRVAISATLEKPLNRLTKNIYSLNLSSEHDWDSVGGSYTFSKDDSQRNSTLTAGAGITLDSIKPIGGAPFAFSTMQSGTQPKDGNQSRNTVDLMLGVTKVINRKTLTQLNLGFSQSNGYNTDPYKIISQIDSNSGQPTEVYYFESRPDSRQRQTLYWQTVHHLTADVINIAYRYYQDDWGISSHTIDLKYRYELSDTDFLQPHLRFYSQTAADFYRHSLLTSEALPDFASADFRLAEFDSTTIGLKYSHKLRQNQNLSARLELMRQSGNSHPADAIGEQTQHNLYPDLTAVILQFSYSLNW